MYIDLTQPTFWIMLSAALLPQVRAKLASHYKPVKNEAKFVELSEVCSANKQFGQLRTGLTEPVSINTPHPAPHPSPRPPNPTPAFRHTDASVTGTGQRTANYKSCFQCFTRFTSAPPSMFGKAPRPPINC